MFILKKLKEYIIDYDYTLEIYDRNTKMTYINYVRNGFYDLQALNKHIIFYKNNVIYSLEILHSTTFKNLTNNGQLMNLTINYKNIEKQFLLDTDMKVCQYYIPGETNYRSLTYKKFLNGNSVWKVYHKIILHDKHLEYGITNMIFHGKFKKCIVEIFNFGSLSSMILIYIKSHKGLILNKIKRTGCRKKDIYENGVYMETRYPRTVYRYVRNHVDTSYYTRFKE
jgi:hypothetical protein